MRRSGSDWTRWRRRSTASLVGPQGEPGEKGDPGDPGEGVPAGGSTGQVLAKASATDHDTEWVDQTGGGGGGTVEGRVRWSV